MRWGVVVGVAVVLGTVGCSAGGLERDDSADTFTVLGTLHLMGNDVSVDPTSAPKGTVCTGRGGAEDITPGAQITVKDASSSIVALGSLGEGSYDGPGTYDCAFVIEIPGVPKGHDFYSVSVADRGELRYTSAEMSKPLSLQIEMK